MKKILRSVTWMAAAEKADATTNLRYVDPDRLLNLRKTERDVLQQALEFYQRTTEAPQFKVLMDHFEKLGDGEAVVLLEETAAETPYLGASFTDLLEQEIESQAASNLANTCKNAIKIATQGLKIKNTTVKGTDEAIAYLFAEARGKPSSANQRMAASMRKSSRALTDLYHERKKNPHQTYGVMTGYGLFDRATAGIRKKQLYLHVGFGGHLKSTHMLNMVLNAAVDGGWNPLVFTSEMPAEDLKLLLCAMHSANPKFQPHGRPLNAFRLLLGALKKDEEDFFEQVKEDLNTNPAHGSIRVVDTADFTTFGSVCQRTTREHAEEEVDILWVDYLTRLPVDAKYRGMDLTTARNETIADAKRFAMQFNGGEGLAVCSPFQMNRDGYKHAKANEGKITMTALATYNAAEKEADIISYIWFDLDEQATSEPKIGLLKSRWGKADATPVNVFIEPDSRRILDLTAGMTVQAGYAPTAGTNVTEEVVL